MANDSSFLEPVVPDGPVVPVALSLGSNLGDRASHLDWAIEQLETRLTDLRVSSYVDTEPVDVDGPQPRYLNAAAVGRTRLAPRALLGWLLELERARGRERPAPRAPRTLDLDLILYGNLIIDEPGLTVPHPGFRRRTFVLEPLSEVAPDVTDPVTGLTLAALWRRIISDL